MNARNIDAFLTLLQKHEEGKWGFARSKVGEYWQVEYRGFAPPCKFHLELDDGMLFLHAKLGFAIWAHCHLSLYRFMLRLNEEIVGAKFGLSHAGEVSLMVDWPLANEGFASFRSAVRLLLECYERYYHDLVLVAQDRKLAQDLTAAELNEVRLEEELAIEVLDGQGHPVEQRSE